MNQVKQKVVINGYFPSWIQFISMVPQGSILGQVLFEYFLNDLDNGVVNRILKFADDTKFVNKVKSEAEVKALQSDLQRCLIRLTNALQHRQQ